MSDKEKWACGPKLEELIHEVCGFTGAKARAVLEVKV